MDILLGALPWVLYIGVVLGAIIFVAWLVDTLKGIRRDLQAIADRIHDLDSGLRSSERDESRIP